MFSKVWIINIFLMMLIGIISVSTWGIWQKDTGVMPDSVFAETDTVSPKKRNMVKNRLQSRSEYDVIVDNNLFSSDRMVNIQDVEEEPLSETEEEVKIDGEKVELYGVIIMNDYKKALINNPVRGKGNKDNLWIAEGDRVGNLDVKQIGQEHILLSDGVKNYNISLYDPKKRKKPKLKSRKSNAPQVISAGEKAVSAKKKSSTSKTNIPKKHEKAKISKDGKYQIIDTPFGKIKRRIK